ncbi:hypothetical protein [Hymenobacter cellulosilyticus]|uniref:Uncharacterized protein n=1 Tax=Hymenobacter cellulosilyticus TaxID=2932248 RepID=A0A8T9Q4Z5_9BACT|nr:hypothetical protein [Hymenobacter cellulosilyticus]UOQ71501.1 hypothetical protein MUN79_23250 [Hymenobacter cellulosilyticus]
MTIKRIELGRAALAGLVGRIGQTTVAQDHTTTEVTRDRQTVKAEAAQKAEVLRLLVVALTKDAALRGELKKPLSKMLPGKDYELLAYLRKVDEAVDTLLPADLADAGYDPRVRQTLQSDVQELTATQGLTRQIEVGTSTATATLPELLAAARETLETELDPFVRAQELAQPELVRQYEAARTLVKTAATRKAEYRGRCATASRCWCMTGGRRAWWPPRWATAAARG